MRNRILAILLLVITIISCIPPVGIFAVEGEEEDNNTSNVEYVDINDNKYLYGNPGELTTESGNITLQGYVKDDKVILPVYELLNDGYYDLSTVERVDYDSVKEIYKKYINKPNMYKECVKDSNAIDVFINMITNIQFDLADSNKPKLYLDVFKIIMLDKCEYTFYDNNLQSSNDMYIKSIKEEDSDNSNRYESIRIGKLKEMLKNFMLNRVLVKAYNGKEYKDSTYELIKSEDLIGIYSNIILHHTDQGEDSSKYAILYYAGCDYHKDSGRFVYYTLKLRGSYGDNDFALSDGFELNVFSSKEFIYLDTEGMQKDFPGIIKSGDTTGNYSEFHTPMGEIADTIISTIKADSNAIVNYSKYITECLYSIEPAEDDMESVEDDAEPSYNIKFTEDEKKMGSLGNSYALLYELDEFLQLDNGYKINKLWEIYNSISDNSDASLAEIIGSSWEELTNTQSNVNIVPNRLFVLGMPYNGNYDEEDPTSGIKGYHNKFGGVVTTDLVIPEMPCILKEHEDLGDHTHNIEYYPGDGNESLVNAFNRMMKEYKESAPGHGGLFPNQTYYIILNKYWGLENTYIQVRHDACIREIKHRASYELVLSNQVVMPSSSTATLTSPNLALFGDTNFITNPEPFTSVGIKSGDTIKYIVGCIIQGVTEAMIEINNSSNDNFDLGKVIKSIGILTGRIKGKVNCEPSYLHTEGFIFDVLQEYIFYMDSVTFDSVIDIDFMDTNISANDSNYDKIRKIIQLASINNSYISAGIVEYEGVEDKVRNSNHNSDGKHALSKNEKAGIYLYNFVGDTSYRKNNDGTVTLATSIKDSKCSACGDLLKVEYTYEYIGDIWNKLNSYQKASLSLLARGKLEKANAFVKKALHYIIRYDSPIDYIDKESLEKNGMTSSTFLIDETRELIEKYNDANLTVTTMMHTNIIRCCNVLSRYILADAIYGSASLPDDSLFSLSNDNLDILAMVRLYELPDTSRGASDNRFVAQIPEKISKLETGDKSDAIYSLLLSNKLSGNRYHANNYLDLLNIMLYNVDLGFSTCAFSDLGKNVGITLYDIAEFFEIPQDSSIMSGINKLYGDKAKEFKKGLQNTDIKEFELSNEECMNTPLLACYDNFDEESKSEYLKIKEWMANNAKSDAWTSTEYALPFDSDSTNFCINMLRSIIELHDMCKFLGISKDDWSPVIKFYLDIYDANEEFFELLRNSNLIYSRSATGSMSEEEPLGVFFSIGDKEMTDQWNRGFAISALYVPMETNVYDTENLHFLISDKDWISEFYYKYAFYRKALYINTDGSAIVNEFASGSKSNTKPATLRDLLNYDRDIILTVDDNFYNADEINSVIDKLEYTAIRSTISESDTENKTTSLINKIGAWFSELSDITAGEILKTGEHKYYSYNFAKNVTKFGKTPDYANNSYDAYVLSVDDILGNESAKIESVISADEYSVKQSYGVVSAIYRNIKLYNAVIDAITVDNAIFKSSKTICTMPGTTQRDWRSLYNYCMISNLEEQIRNDASSSLDLDAPIFVDIFGNILTESGLVIIPAACNATLCKTYWTPYTIGWSEYYNNGNKLEIGEFPDNVYSWLTGLKYEGHKSNLDGYTLSSGKASKVNGGGYFTVNEQGELVLRTSVLKSNNLVATVQWEFPNKNADDVQHLLYNDAYFSKAQYIYSSTLLNLVTEVMRGCPIEFLDYTKEGLSGNRDISKYGIYTAYKLEEIVDSFIGEDGVSSVIDNTIVTMPNLAHMEGIEYIMLYLYKITFAVGIIGLAVSIIYDATRGTLGFGTAGRLVASCLGVIVAFTLIPSIIEWSYYNSNKNLLTQEIGDIVMLNYTKEFDSAEIGVVDIRTPESSGELYLKIGDVNIDWWEIISKVLFTNTYDTVSDLYREQIRSNTIAVQDHVIQKGDGLYIDVMQVLDSTEIVYLKDTQTIENRAYKLSDANNQLDTIISYASPYYMFLDQLILNINNYNKKNDVNSFSYSVGTNGHIVTYDVIAPYLHSDIFVSNDYDLLSLEHILLEDTSKLITDPNFLNKEDYNLMKYSLWYPSVSYSENEKRIGIEKLYNYAKSYIQEYQDIIGRIPDEVFIKIFALQLAMKYNDIFNIPQADSIEIMNVDTRDLLRFMVTDKDKVYKNYSYSFARFVYEESNALGVLLAGILCVTIAISNLFKPLLLLLIIGILVFNTLARRMLFQKQSRCVEGYIIACALLCIVNYIYSILLKLCMNVTSFTNSVVLSLFIAILVQVAYVCSLICIVAIEIKDWRNNGYNDFVIMGNQITTSIAHTQQRISDAFNARFNPNYETTRRDLERSRGEYDRNSIDDMLERDSRREESIYS